MSVKLKQNEQIGIGILAITAVIILGWFVIIEPQLRGIATNQKNIDDANKTLIENKAKLEDAERKKAQLEQADLNTNSFPGQTSTMAKENIITDQIDKVLRLLKDNNNDIIKIKRIPYNDSDAAPPPAAAPTPGTEAAPAPAGISQYLIEVPIEIMVRGTYKSIGSFIKGINESPNIIKIYEVQIIHDIAGDQNALNAGTPYIEPSKPLKAKIGLVFLIKTRSWSEQTKSSEAAQPINAPAQPDSNVSKSTPAAVSTSVTSSTSKSSNTPAPSTTSVKMPDVSKDSATSKVKTP